MIVNGERTANNDGCHTGSDLHNHNRHQTSKEGKNKVRKTYRDRNLQWHQLSALTAAQHSHRAGAFQIHRRSRPRRTRRQAQHQRRRCTAIDKCNLTDRTRGDIIVRGERLSLRHANIIGCAIVNGDAGEGRALRL